MFQKYELRYIEEEVDKLQIGHLQSASLLSAFPEIKDWWASVEKFIISPLLTGK